MGRSILFLIVLMLFWGCNMDSSDKTTFQLNFGSSQGFVSSSEYSTNVILNHFDTNVAYSHTQTIPGSGFVNSLLNKEDINIVRAFESSPFIFKGKYYLMVCVRPSQSANTVKNTFVGIYTVDGKNDLISSTGYFTTFSSAFVYNNTLYIYSALISDPKHPQWVFYTTDLVTWNSNEVFSQTENIPEAPCNTSVCYDGTRFVMALEVGYYYPVFAESTDGLHFSLISNAKYNKDNYDACPVIRYYNGYYYLVYLVYSNKKLIEKISRSTDLTNWEDSIRNPVLIPEGADCQDPTCYSASDIDFVEYNGQVHFYYCISDQNSWMRIRRAYFAGTLADFLDWFY